MLNEFIQYLIDQIGQPYLWGGQHTKLTPENYISVIEKKEDKEGNRRIVETYCESKFAEGETVLYAYDCSGLGIYWLYNVKHIYKRDMSANTMMGHCDLKDEPPQKGWWVFRMDGERARHIGYMIDDEYLIEAKGRKYGVAKTKFNKKEWGRWGIPDVFKDEIVEPEPTPEPPVVRYKVVVVGGSVNVRDTDSKSGKILFTAHKGNRFNLIDISADTGWYHIETYKGPAYISNREDLTCLITVS